MIHSNYFVQKVLNKIFQSIYFTPNITLKLYHLKAEEFFTQDSSLKIIHSECFTQYNIFKMFEIKYITQDDSLKIFTQDVALKIFVSRFFTQNIVFSIFYSKYSNQYVSLEFISSIYENVSLKINQNNAFQIFHSKCCIQNILSKSFF